MGSGISKKSSNNINKLPQRYYINNILGKGASSIVYLGQDLLSNNNNYINYNNSNNNYNNSNNKNNKNNNNLLAIKSINLSKYSNNFNNLKHTINISLNELNILKRIQKNDFIIYLYSSFYYKTNCYFILQYFNGGDLRQFIKNNTIIDEKSIIYLISCIGSALNYCHTLGIIHRDIKPENICLDLNGKPYLTDFGISEMVENNHKYSKYETILPISSSSSGTLLYLAPEILARGNHHSYQVDFWSLGVVMYELLFKVRPYQKHCPNACIKFSSLEYSELWKKLIQIKDESLYIPISVDFNQLYTSSIDLKDPILKSLQIALPMSSVYLSEDTVSLLNGLLDVRIPFRLGNIDKFEQFSSHPAFIKYEYTFSSLPNIQSPLQSYNFSPPSSACLQGLVSEEEYQNDINTFNQKFQEDIFNPFDVTDTKETWFCPPEFEKQLQSFSYNHEEEYSKNLFIETLETIKSFGSISRDHETIEIKPNYNHINQHHLHLPETIEEL